MTFLFFRDENAPRTSRDQKKRDKVLYVGRNDMMIVSLSSLVRLHCVNDSKEVSTPATTSKKKGTAIQ